MHLHHLSGLRYQNYQEIPLFPFLYTPNLYELVVDWLKGVDH